MQNTMSFKKVQMGILAVAMAAIVAFSMGIGAQMAYASNALPVGKTKTVKMSNGLVITYKNAADDPAVTVTKVKAPKSMKNIKIPNTVELNGFTFKVTKIAKKAFNGTKAKTITLGKNVYKFDKEAFKGSKATKIVITNAKKPLKKSYRVNKNWLKGSKVKTVQVKSNKSAWKSVAKKSYSGKSGVKVKK